MQFTTTKISLAQQLDRQDGLASFRERFLITDTDLIYLDGNSLGRLPKSTVNVVRDAVERQWGERLIRGWNDGWVHQPTHLGEKIAQLIGAQPDEVLVSEATSVNLFKLAVAALRLRPGRSKIVSDEFNFPSDLYILQGINDLLGGQPRPQNRRLPTATYPTLHLVRDCTCREPAPKRASPHHARTVDEARPGVCICGLASWLIARQPPHLRSWPTGCNSDQPLG